MTIRKRLQTTANTTAELTEILTEQFNQRFSKDGSETPVNFLGIMYSDEGYITFSTTAEPWSIDAVVVPLCVSMVGLKNFVTQKLAFPANFTTIAYSADTTSHGSFNFKPEFFVPKVSVDYIDCGVAQVQYDISESRLAILLNQAIKKVGLKAVKEAIPQLSLLDLQLKYSSVERKDFHITEFNNIIY